MRPLSFVFNSGAFLAAAVTAFGVGSSAQVPSETVTAAERAELYAKLLQEPLIQLSTAIGRADLDDANATCVLTSESQIGIVKIAGAFTVTGEVLCTPSAGHGTNQVSLQFRAQADAARFAIVYALTGMIVND